MLFGLAVLCVTGRIATRLYTRRRLFLDDGFLIFGLMCLGAGTGLIHVYCRTIFVVQATKMDPTIVIPIDQDQSLAHGVAIVDS